MTKPAIASVLALCLALLGCASGGSFSKRLPADTACSIVYAFRGGQSLAVINRSFGPLDKQDNRISIVDDRVLRALVTDYERLGFFEKARAGSGFVGRDSITIRIGDASHVLVKPNTPAELDRWRTYVGGVTLIYNEGERHVGDAARGRGRDLHRASRDLAERNRKAREALQRRLRSSGSKR